MNIKVKFRINKNDLMKTEVFINGIQQGVIGDYMSEDGFDDQYAREAVIVLTNFIRVLK